MKAYSLLDDKKNIESSGLFYLKVEPQQAGELDVVDVLGGGEQLHEADGQVEETTWNDFKELGNSSGYEMVTY